MISSRQKRVVWAMVAATLFASPLMLLGIAIFAALHEASGPEWWMDVFMLASSAVLLVGLIVGIVQFAKTGKSGIFVVCVVAFAVCRFVIQGGMVSMYPFSAIAALAAASVMAHHTPKPSLTRVS